MKLFLALLLLFSVSAQADVYTFPLNQPRDLNFKDKTEIFRVRNKMISQYPIFFQGEYQAETSSVFRQIEGGKPWWGLKGLLCYGPGELSIEGPSDESRFIDNPFLLVSVEEGNARVFMDKKDNCPLSYPTPNKITFNSDKMTFYVDYNVSAHDRTLSILEDNYRHKHTPMTYSFNGRNAIDFGVSYVYASNVSNLHFVGGRNMAQDVYQFRDFIHVGGSCGYPGGCNNGSPHQEETNFEIERYPATAIFKLWREKPASPNEPADLIYQITLH